MSTTDFAARAEKISRHAGHRRRAHRHRRGRHQIQEPHRRAGHGLRRGHRGRRRVHPVEMPVGAGRFLPRRILPAARRGSLVVNSGNANAFTGKKGRESTAMTGKAGRPRPPAARRRGLPGLDRRDRRAARCRQVRHLLAGMAKEAEPSRWLEAAKAIMTTDTFPKVATATVKLGDADVTINGIAKGAGMIAPDMATMLSFVATDAPIAAPVLQALLSNGVGKTFNAITVDSDTSTSDTLLLFATGAAAKRGAPASTMLKDPRLGAFRRGARPGAEVAGAAGGARRRGRAQAGRGHRHRREIGALGQAHRAVDRQFAAGQDGDRRRGRQLGPRRHGRRQGRRTGRPRPAVDLVRRQSRWPSRASAIPTIPKRRPPPT